MNNYNNNISESARAVVQKLREQGKRVAFAESCTGGMAAAAITSVAGSSNVLDMSVVTYSNYAKIEYTDVTQDILDKHGAVSSETARLMAQGIRARSGADITAGITGIAGPDGGTPDKPVGTVFIAVDSWEQLIIQHFTFTGDRQSIREQTTQQVLIMLRECMG
jgi:PncC family amidohydrolase